MKHIYKLIFLTLSVQSGFCAQNWMNYTTAYIISDMAEHNNFIWASSYGGLIRFDKSTNTSAIYTGANSELHYNATQLVEVDGNGKVWVSYTNNYGVSSFDGYGWNHYNSFPNGKSLGAILCMHVDYLNRFWCLYGNSYTDSLGNLLQDRGIAMFDNINWAFYDSTVIPEVWMSNSFDIDTLGNIWLSSVNGVIKFDGINTTTYNTSNSILNANSYGFFAVDKKNNVWVATSNISNLNLNRIYTFSNGSWIQYTDSLSLIAAKSYRLYIGKDNKKYFYKNNSDVYLFDDITWSVVPDSGFQSLNISAFVVDTASNLWSSTSNASGCYVREYDGTTIHDWQSSICSIKDDYGIGVEIDSAGNKWLLSESGLSRYDGITFTDMTPFQTTHWPSFEDILIDKNQNVWVGSYDMDMATDDLFRYDGISWTSYPYPAVYDMEMDSSGNIWFVSGTDLLKYDGTNFTSYNLAQFSTFLDPRSLTIDISQRIWISCYSVILIFDGNSSWTVLNQINSPIDPQKVLGIKADKSGWVWIPDLNGCYQTDGTTWNYITAGWLKGGGNYKLLVDSQSTVWIATGNCLAHYDGSSFINYTAENCGMGSNYVKDFEVDKNGNAWLALTYGGFAVWNKSGLKEFIGYTKCKIEGNVFLDDNSNGLFDTTEVKIPYQQTILLPDSVYVLTNHAGSYSYFVDSGLYNVNFIPFSPWTLSSSSASFSINAQSGNYCCYDFGINSNQQKEQIEIDVEYGGLRCYSQQQVWMMVKNTGTIVIDAIAYLVLDTTCSFLYSQPSPTSISSDTLFWDLGLMTPFQISHMNIFIQIGAPPDSVRFSAGIINKSTGIIMDSYESVEIISCSFDPNDKIVQPAGVNEQHYTLLSDSLTYTIRFQNTGNDTAFFVIIRDTLDEALDFSTLEYVSSSHSCSISCTNMGAAEFRFDNILLPYKTLDEPNSNGFVKFRLKVKPVTLDYTLIRNMAYIQFDFNPSIKTNTTENTMVNVIPIGINSPTIDWDCTLFPNPVTSVSRVSFKNDFHDKHILTFYDLTGKIIEKHTSNSTFITIYRQSFLQGIYLWKLVNQASGISVNGKMIVQ